MACTRALYFSTLFSILLVGANICFGELKGPGHTVENFFETVDQDGDGEIEQHEVTQFMASLTEAPEPNETAGDGIMSDSFNFSYGGNTISFEEMLDHLQNMLTTDHVVEWIKHGLQLPQYAEAFKMNSVNGLDFPSLIENASWTLATEIGVSSPMHCKRITYAITRQIFGFGAPPGPPCNVKCNALPTGGIQLQWNSPQFLGYPPVHKYVIYRWEVSSSAWIPISETNKKHFLDQNVQADVIYSYHIQGWGGHGSSEMVTLTPCSVSESSKSDSFASIDFLKTVSDIAERVNVHSFDISSKKDRSHEPDTITKANNFWAWMFSVNGGLLLLGILSRQSFLFRASLAAWVLFKIHILHKIYWTVLQARSSECGWLRVLAHTLIFMKVCCIYIHAKISFLSRQAIGFRPTLGPISPSDNENKFLTRTGTFHDAIGYSVASCTLDEMLECTKKRPLDARLIQSNDWIRDWISTCDASGRTSSKLMSNEAFMPADKNPPDNLFAEGKGPRQRVYSKENSPCSKLPDNVVQIKKQVKASGLIHTNEVEDFMNSSSEAIGPSAARCLSAPASVDLFTLSTSDSECDQNADGEGHSRKSRDDIYKQKRRMPLATTKRTRSRCNQEGCRIRFDRWHSFSDWQMRLSCHYCRECQGVFCAQHTRISPHGRHGQCGFDSNCYCSGCFQRLAKEVQQELENLNKLHSRGPQIVKLFGHNRSSKPGKHQTSSHFLGSTSLECPESTTLSSKSLSSMNLAAPDQATSMYGQKHFPERMFKSARKALIKSSHSEHCSNADGIGSTILPSDALHKVEHKF